MNYSQSDKQRLLLAMSGGVDSSAAIALLKRDYDVIGVTFRFFGDFDTLAAKSVARRFSIEHHIVDRTSDFKERVIQPFADSWFAGLTPNPCAVCNRDMKFPALFEKADELGCDLVATGHYARCENGVLKCALTETGEINPKDQSYMLYTLTPCRLSRIVFPLGNLSKAAVRRIAAESELNNADKPDSQDICFVLDGDYVSFIEEFTGRRSEAGDFTDKTGRVIGKHNGHIHYTLGQRRGLGISSHERLYVTSKDAISNAVTVGAQDELFVKTFEVCDVVWHRELVQSATVKTRYTPASAPCTICPVGSLGENRVRVTLETPQKTVAPGQCAVFYDGVTVVGGGIIC